MQPIAYSSSADRSRGPVSALVGILPLLLLAADTYVEPLLPQSNVVGGFQFPAETIGEYLQVAPWLVVSLAIIVGSAIGWLRGFPRWSFSYLGALLLVGPIAVAGALSEGYRIYGLVAWIPAVALGVSIAYLLATSARSFGRLVSGIGADWTRLSFALLTLLTPLYLGVVHDAPGVFTLGTVVLVAVGSVAYLMTSTVRGGALALLVPVVLMGLIPAVLLWVAQLGDPLSSDVGSLAYSVVLYTGIVLGFVFWPGVIGLVRWATRGQSRSRGESEGMGG